MSLEPDGDTPAAADPAPFPFVNDNTSMPGSALTPHAERSESGASWSVAAQEISSHPCQESSPILPIYPGLSKHLANQLALGHDSKLPNALDERLLPEPYRDSTEMCVFTQFSVPLPAIWMYRIKQEGTCPSLWEATKVYEDPGIQGA